MCKISLRGLHHRRFSNTFLRKDGQTVRVPSVSGFVVAVTGVLTSLCY